MKIGAAAAFGLLAALAVALIGILSVSTFWTTHATPADRVRPGTLLADVQIGGTSRDSIRDVVRARLERYADTVITVETADGAFRFKANDLGYKPEIEATVARVEAVGVPLKREQLMAELSGGEPPREIKPAASIDQARLEATLANIAPRFEKASTDAGVRVNPDVSIELLPGKTGQRIDRAELSRRLTSTFAELGTTVQLPLEPTRPSVADSDTTEAIKAAEQFVARPLEVRAAGHSWTLTRADLASWMVFEKVPDGAGHKLKLAMHPERPRRWLDDRGRDIARPARDARIGIKGGQTVVVAPEENGLELDELASLALLLSGGARQERKVDLAVIVHPPKLVAADAAKMKFPDVLAEASTVYGGSISERNHNVELATSRLDGALIPAGATFSFNETVGRTRLRDGYKMAFGISSSEDGVQTVPSVAGGICQVATTLFHAAFWSGMPIAERNHHLYWIPKYGVPPRGLTGLDATVDEDAGLDFRFRNATDAPILVQSSTDGTRVTFRLHGTKPGWEVVTSGPSLTNFVKHDPTFVRQEEATLVAGRAIQVEEARDGFDALIVRTVSRTGGAVDRLEVRSSYVPSRNVVLVGTRR